MKITNPVPIVHIGDPYILYFDETYYLYATSHFNGYYCWRSHNLCDWEAPVICYEASARSFGNACFWAPEVYEFEGRFYMYYTAQWKKYINEELRIGVAVADRPEGPFYDVWEERPMFDFGYGVLDAHVLKDQKNYFYYSRAGANHIVNGVRQSEIYVAELGKDYVSVVGEGKLILKPEQAWEMRQPEKAQFWNEGPFVMKHDNRYHLMYSANCFTSRYYALGAAVADDPMGPFVKYRDNPVLSTSDKISGPGHNSVVRDKDGHLYCVYHAHTDYDHPSGDRQVYITPLVFRDGRIRLEHPCLG